MIVCEYSNKKTQKRGKKHLRSESFPTYPEVNGRMC